MERSFSMTSNSSEDSWKVFDIEIAVAFFSLFLSRDLRFPVKIYESDEGDYRRNGVINQFVMKNVKRSFITKLSTEERESDEIGLPRSFVNRWWN